MKPRHRVVIAIAILSATVLWLAKRPAGNAPPTTYPAPLAESPDLSPPPPSTTVPAASPTVATPTPEPATPSPPASASPPPHPARHPATLQLSGSPLIAADTPAAPPPRRVSDVDPDLALVFDQITLMFRDYRTLNGENPIGTNDEMMKAIMGGNPKGATLGPPEGQSVNEKGELIDRWGSPYFFHQLRKDHLEIRSAGPDRRMWNEDDLISD